MAAAVFACPGFMELTGRRHMDGLGAILRQAPRATRHSLADDRLEVEAVRNGLRDERLGGHKASRRLLTIAAVLLLISFLFDLLYALTKEAST